MCLGFCCHVRQDVGAAKVDYIMACGWLPGPVGASVGVLGLAFLAGWLLWWSDFGPGVLRLLCTHPFFVLGVLFALSPFVVYNLRVWLLGLPHDSSLAMWIRAPWELGSNVRDGLRALGALIAAEPGPAVYSVDGEGMAFTREPWKTINLVLIATSHWLIVSVFALIAMLAWSDRADWRRFFALKSDRPATPTRLMIMGILVLSLLYLLQATSANATSMRYLVPLWIFLPGLLACALVRLSPGVRGAALLLLLGSWVLGQTCIFQGLARGSPARPLEAKLASLGVKAFVSSTHVVLLTADLMHGRIGGVDYNSNWSRLNGRYADRFQKGEPIVCVLDKAYAWFPGDGLDEHLSALHQRNPETVRLSEKVGAYELWEIDLPLSRVLETEDSAGLPDRLKSASMNK